MDRFLSLSKDLGHRSKESVNACRISVVDCIARMLFSNQHKDSIINLESCTILAFVEVCRLTGENLNVNRKVLFLF